MSETKARRALPAGWGWHHTDDAFLALARDAVRAEEGSSIAVVEGHEWRVFKGESSFAIVVGDLADSPEAARAAAEDECWRRGLFGTDAVTVAQPPTDPPWRWGEIRFTDGAERCGRFCEEPWCGTWRIVVDELQTDGAYERVIYPASALVVEHPLTEDTVRRAVLPERGRGPCDEFTEPSARPGRCRACGHDKAKHEAKRAGVPWEPGEVQVAGD
jgi:hypothetical protein